MPRKLSPIRIANFLFQTATRRTSSCLPTAMFYNATRNRLDLMLRIIQIIFRLSFAAICRIDKTPFAFYAVRELANYNRILNEKIERRHQRRNRYKRMTNNLKRDFSLRNAIGRFCTLPNGANNRYEKRFSGASNEKALPF